MRFSLRLNNDLTIPEYSALAQAAEAVGFDQLWISNDLFLRSDLVILNAQDVAGEPAAVLEVPRRVPAGFHGNWVNAAE